MREAQTLPTAREGIVRLVIYRLPTGHAYLFLYDQFEDGPCVMDEYFTSVDEAREHATRNFGASPGGWVALPDPLPGCQHDWIAPVRRDRRASQRGSYERLENGRWIAFRLKTDVP